MGDVRKMSDFKMLRTRSASGPQVRKDAVYARTAADDDAGTGCRAQARGALRLVQDATGAAVYADARRSGLDADRPALRRLMADIRRGGLRCVVVRDLARLARNAAVLKTILDEFRAAGVEVVTTREGNRDA